MVPLAGHHHLLHPDCGGPGAVSCMPHPLPQEVRPPENQPSWSLKCFTLCRTYAVRLAEQGRAIPPGYVLEKDLSRRIKEEVDAVQMDTIFRHMGRW